MRRLAAIAVAALLVALFVGADDIAAAFRSTASPEVETLLLEETEGDRQPIETTEEGARQVELGVLLAGVDSDDRDEEAPQVIESEEAAPTDDDDPAEDDAEEFDDSEADRDDDDAADAEDEASENEEEEDSDGEVDGDEVDGDEVDGDEVDGDEVDGDDDDGDDI